MKIAIASENNFVSGHFGHCESFTLYTVEDSSVVNKEIVANPGHRPGFLPVFLKDLGTNTVIAGGMGETAQQLFAQNGIKVVTGAEGLCDSVMDLYLKGELKSTGEVCTAHQHEGHCNE